MQADVYVSGAYGAMVPNWHVEESPWKVRQIVRMLARHRLTPRTVGDVGCGVGEVLHGLQPYLPPQCELWGYDIAPEAIARCQALAGERLHFHLGDIRRQPGVQHDLLLALDVVEHVEDCYGFLRDLRPLAREKIFHFPLDLSVQTVIRPRALLKVRAAYGHLHYFTKELALAMLRDTGYEIRDTFYTPRLVELPSHLRSVNLMRLPRKMTFAVRPDAAVRLLGGYGLLVLAC